MHLNMFLFALSFVISKVFIDDFEHKYMLKSILLGKAFQD